MAGLAWLECCSRVGPGSSSALVPQRQLGGRSAVEGKWNARGKYFSRHLRTLFFRFFFLRRQTPPRPEAECGAREEEEEETSSSFFQILCHVEKGGQKVGGVLEAQV